MKKTLVGIIVAVVATASFAQPATILNDAGHHHQYAPTDTYVHLSDAERMVYIEAVVDTIEILGPPPSMANMHDCATHESPEKLLSVVDAYVRTRKPGAGDELSPQVVNNAIADFCAIKGQSAKSQTSVL